MDSRYAGKRKMLSFGAYPAVSLKDARRKRDKARELLSNDIGHGAQKMTIHDFRAMFSII